MYIHVCTCCMYAIYVWSYMTHFSISYPCAPDGWANAWLAWRERNASCTGKVAEVPMLNCRCGTEHANTGEILSRKESRRHESCPRSHHRPRSVFFGARELQFCPCSTVSAPALLPSYLRGPAGRCCKTRVRARGRPEIQDRELLLTLGAVSVQGRTVTCATAPGVL